jgi:predicted AlkP superfamily phosphohydrolase/phosphomutase
VADAPRAVVIGLDAFDADIAFELIDEGRLPTLAGLLVSLAWARTITPPGMVVGTIWPTITTGSWPSRHGFYCDRQLRTGTYEIHSVGPRDIAGPRVWDVLAASGRRCVLLDAPITAPTSLPSGAHLVEYGTHDRFEPTGSEPPELLHEILERFGPYTVPEKCDDFALAGDYAGLRDALVSGARLKTRVMSEYLARDEWDFFFGVFSESHCAGHQFWSYHDPTHPAHDSAAREQLGDVLTEVYEAVDTGLGELLAHVPTDASLVVLLSHGIGPHYDGGQLMSAILRGLDSEAGLDRVVAFRERALRRLHRRRRQQQRATPVDSVHRFFKIPSNDEYAGVRFNVKGREPRGRLRPGRELDAAIDRLSVELSEVENADTGDPVFAELIRTRDVYDGPLVDALPDLLCGWARTAPIRGVRSPRIGTLWSDTTALRTGDHRGGGLALVRHGGIPAGELPAPIPVTDLAPTIAAWLGAGLPDADGAPIPAMITG